MPRPCPDGTETGQPEGGWCHSAPAPVALGVADAQTRQALSGFKSSINTLVHLQGGRLVPLCICLQTPKSSRSLDVITWYLPPPEARNKRRFDIETG